MPLKSTGFLRIMQITTFCLLLLLVVITSFASSLSVHQYDMLLYLVVDHFKESSPWFSGKEKYWIVLSLVSSQLVSGLSLITQLIIASISATEKRRCLIIAIILCCIFGILNAISGGVCLWTRSLTYRTIDDAFVEIVDSYGILDNDHDFVDKIQILGGCCGYQNYLDYESSFKTIIAKSEENYVVCLKGEHERKIGPQQIPFSCCSNPAVFEGCFAGVFNWTFPQCGIGSSPSGYLKNGCKKFISKSTSDLDVIGSLMIITGALFFLILSLNIVLTINILPTKALVVEEIFNEFQLDPNQAQKLENAFDMTTMTQTETGDTRRDLFGTEDENRTLKSDFLLSDRSDFSSSPHTRSSAEGKNMEHSSLPGKNVDHSPLPEKNVDHLPPPGRNVDHWPPETNPNYHPG